MWMYSTVNVSHQFYGRGVIPDFSIQQTVQEFVDDKNAAMEKAVELIRKE